MLGKLMKHEWKNINKVGGIMILLMAAVTAIGCIMLHLPGITALFSEGGNLSEIELVGWILMGVMTLLIYIFMLIGATYGMFIFLGVRFYRTMYTDQGYLTNTLPVTAHQLLISKMLVSGIWYFIIGIAVVVSILALFFSLFNGLLRDTLAAEGYSIWGYMGMLFSEMVEAYEEMGMNMTNVAVTMGIMMVVSPFATIVVLFGSLTLGQLSKKHKGLMGVLAYFGVVFVNMIISSIVQIVNSVRLSLAVMSDPYGEVTMDTSGSYISSLIVVVVLAVVLYCTSHHILTKKLNMD